jgi:predicted RNA binding protein YcfA (HicA-like mRNA interferase family)
VKRRELIQRIEQIGANLVRHGARHDWYRNPINGVSQAVPRHPEINENLAKHILRALSARPGER